VDNRPVENALPNLSAIAEAPRSWAYVRRGQPNEETADCKLAFDVKEAEQATKKTRGSDMVAEGMMKIHTAL